MDALQLAIATAAEENRALAAEVELLQLHVHECRTENALISGTLQAYFGWLSSSHEEVNGHHRAARDPSDVVAEFLRAVTNEMSQCLLPLITGRNTEKISCHVWTPILASVVTLWICYVLSRYSATALALRWRLGCAKARVEQTVRETAPQWSLKVLAAERIRHRQTQVALLKILVATAGFVLYMTFVLSATNALSMVLWFFGYEHYEAAPNLWSSIVQLPAMLFGQSLLDRGVFHYLLSLIGVPLFTFVASLLSAAARDVAFPRLVGIDPPSANAVPFVAAPPNTPLIGHGGHPSALPVE